MDYDNDTDTISGIDLLKVIDDSIVVAFGIGFITHGFMISKYDMKLILRRVIYYTIFIIIYRQYVTNSLKKIVRHIHPERFLKSPSWSKLPYP